MRHAFGADFDVPDGYLNTPSIGIPPAHVAEVMADAVRRWACGADQPADFDEPVDVARQAFGKIIGVPSERVAIGATVSQLISLVAAAIPDGSRVLVASGEFTSVTFPFAVQAHRGVEVVEADLAELPSRVDSADLVAVSVVQSANGARVDLDALRENAGAADVPVLLDATQAAGWLPLELAWADWVVAGGYKWLLGPRGASWLAVHPRAMELTRPVAANWYAGEDPWGSSIYGLPLRLARDVRRFDLSPVWPAQVGAAAALSWIAELDIPAVRDHCIGLADKLRARLGLEPRATAIVALAASDADRRLADAGVVASARAGKARVGFHLYNTEADVDVVVRALSAVV